MVSELDMKRILVLLLFAFIGLCSAADYPDVPLEKILPKEQQDKLGISNLTPEQKEALRRTLLDIYVAGLNEGKKQGAKVAVQSQGSSVPSGDVIESQIDGEFEGWEGETIVKLMNGQIWQQTEYHYNYHYAYAPKVMVYRSGGGYKMKVDGTDQAVGVARLR